MNFIFLIIGTVISVFFIILLLVGQKYDYMIENLDGDAFPLKSLYSAGLVLQDFKFGQPLTKFKDKLRADSGLYYSNKYSEYYSRIIWAQIISFSMLILSVFLTFAGLDKSLTAFFVFVGLFLAIFLSLYFYNYTRDKIKKRQEECENEFPNAISKLALMVNSGVILHEAWVFVAEGKDGVLYDLMKKSCDKMKNGMSDIDAIREFGILTNSDDIKKFTSALIQSIEMGGDDLPNFLVNQSTELWQIRKQTMLQKGEKAASALLMPIAMLFAGVMLIVIAAAFQSFSM